MEYIDCTPTWEGILPAIIAVLEHGETDEAKRVMREELKRMAQLADKANRISKEAPKTTEPAKHLMHHAKIVTVAIDGGQDALMILPPNCQCYLGFSEDIYGEMFWWTMPAYVDGTPKVEEFRRVVEDDLGGGGELDRIKDFVVSTTHLIRDVWTKGW